MPHNDLQSASLDQSHWTFTERRLASIWEEVLDTRNIDLDDDFLSLGGDSITATLCVSRVEGVFSLNVPLEVLLDNQATLKGVAAFIEQAAKANGL